MGIIELSDTLVVPQNSVDVHDTINREFNQINQNYRFNDLHM